MFNLLVDTKHLNSSTGSCLSSSLCSSTDLYSDTNSHSSANVLHRPRHRHLPNRGITIAAFTIAVLVLATVIIFGRLFFNEAMATNFAQKNVAPNAVHVFGTDWMGRDMFFRTIAGLSTSILVGLLAASVSAIIALILACVAALGGKYADSTVTWFIDLFMGIPQIVVLILISCACGKGFWGATIAIAVTHWPSLTRVLRAEILQCREAPFIAYARKLGSNTASLVARHMIPYALPQFLIGAILLFPHAIIHEATITFLGFGLPIDYPAIGTILSESMSYLVSGIWWLAFFPGIALIATVMMFDLAGSSLRRIIDPYSSQD